MSPIQTHGPDEIEGIVDADVDPAAGIQESKVSHAASGGHDHDLVGTPTPAVLLVRQLKPTASAPPDFLVNIAASAGVSFPDGRTVPVAGTTIDFTNPLPAGSNARIDLIYLDRAGVVQRITGTPTTGTPVPPSHDGVYPIAEVGPILAGTTSITTGMIKDVRPFLASGPLVHMKLGAVDAGYAHTLVAGSNMSVSVVNGVATLTASGGSGSPVDASTTVKGVVRVTVDPGLGLDPIALSADDPILDLIATAVQADGSVPFTADQSMGGNDLIDIGSLLFASTANIQAGAGGNLNLTTTGVGKVRIISPAALQLPSLTSPVSPNVADIWFDPSIDSPMIRTTAGPVALSTVKTGSIGLAVTEIIGDPVNPPASGTVGDVPTLDFNETVVADQSIRFAFQLPEDALLVEDVKIRLVYCMAAAGAGNVSLGFDYTVVPVNGDLTPAVQTGNGTFTITPSGSAEVHQADESIVLPFGQLSSRASVSMRLRRRSTDAADTRNGNFQLLYVNVIYAKKDIASERNVVEVIDEVTSLGQVTGLQFRGNLVTVTEVAGVGVVDLTDPNTLPATTTTLGVTRIDPAPAISGTPIAVGVNAPYLPLQAEKDALAGTAGTPSGTNRYVTDQDTRLPLQAENDALAGTAGTPSGTNRYVTAGDTRLPLQAENDALVGTAGAGPSGSNPYLLADFPNLPSSGEKAAMAGSSGTPSGSNTFVTRNDPLFVLTTGTRAFTAPQSGVTPTAAAHLATKAYVDSMGSALSGDYAAHVQNLAQLQAVPSVARTDKQLRLVEDEGAIYRFDIQGTGGGVPPNEGLGQWYKVQAATQDHGQLTGLADDDHVQYARLDGVRAFTAPQAGVSPTGATHFTTRGFSDATYAALVHASRHQNGGADQINVAGLSGRLNDSQFITVQDEGSLQGQAHTLNIVGAGGSVAVASGVATLTIPGGGGGGVVAVLDGGSTVVATLAELNFNGTAFAITEAPAGRANAAPIFGTSAGVFTEGNDARLPVAGEKAALAGTNGTPGGGNAYVTNSDPRNTNARTPTAHKASHETGGGDEISLAGLLGRSATSQFISIQDEGASQGQAHTLNIVGASGSIAVASGVATLTLTGGGGSLSVKQDNTLVSASVTTLDFVGFDAAESPAGEINVSMPVATDSRDGLFSMFDRIKLDSIEAGAQIHPVFGNGLTYNIGTETLSVDKTDLENGGALELSVAGLSGVLADPQTAALHAASHQNGGGDEISVAGLSGQLADRQLVRVLDETATVGTVDTLDFQGGGVTATLSGSKVIVTVPAPPAVVFTVKEGGTVVSSVVNVLDFNASGFNTSESPSGEINIDHNFGTGAGTVCQGNDARLSDARTPVAHKTSHQNGGADEIDVAGLSGQLADRQKIRVQDEGSDIGTVDTINLIGSAVSAALNGSKVDITITGGGGGGGGTFNVWVSPEFPSATVQEVGNGGSSGFDAGFDATNFENYYSWSSDQTGVNEGQVVLRLGLPSNFASLTSIEVLHMNSSGSVDAELDVELYGTNNTLVSTSGGADLSSNSWATATVTPTGGTFAASGVITIKFRMYVGQDETQFLGRIRINITTS